MRHPEHRPVEILGDQPHARRQPGSLLARHCARACRKLQHAGHRQRRKPAGQVECIGLEDQRHQKLLVERGDGVVEPDVSDVCMAVLLPRDASSLRRFARITAAPAHAGFPRARQHGR
jgi:hypothetical protein